MASLVLIALIAVLLLGAAQIGGCLAVVVGRGASADGSVLLGHNEENGGRRLVNFRRAARRTSLPGQRVLLGRGGTIPEIPQTAAFLWAENVGLEFSDNYVNEWGVAIVSDACPTREDDPATLAARGEIRQGGIGYMLRRLVAERARSAREGVRLIGDWVERFGYVHSGRTYVVADPLEAWLVAVVCGRRWAARRVSDDAVVIVPNVHILGAIDPGDPETVLASPDLVDYAAARGWYKAAGRPFHFAEVYGQAGSTERPDPRQGLGQRLVTGWQETASAGPLPMEVHPATLLTVAQVARILRYESAELNLYQPGTQESAVFQLRCGMPAGIGCVAWRTTGRPDVAPLLPWYVGVADVPPRYAQAMDLAEALSLERHFHPPGNAFEPDDRLAWWTFERLRALAEAQPERRRAIRAAWDAYEADLFAHQSEREARALAQWQADPEATGALLAAICDQLAFHAETQARHLLESRLQGQAP